MGRLGELVAMGTVGGGCCKQRSPVFLGRQRWATSERPPPTTDAIRRRRCYYPSATELQP
ncbi:hypothetical protein TRIUR3_03509 [Triticum urartu]|uniref:Uncharacterized protein n=1 Tax=Triticum urartu TaxID=4572 RepID=M7ZW46_TRIUA|nr:hypothetical protein TRIUR3_03509 [Triticum urartu]